MKLKQIYVLEDQGNYYYVRNDKILLLKCSYEQQNPDGLLKALVIKKWLLSLVESVRLINGRKNRLGESKWTKKLQSLSVGLKDREKTVCKRELKQKKTVVSNQPLSFTTAIKRCARQANARTRHNKWKRWCNNASKNQQMRALRKEREA